MHRRTLPLRFRTILLALTISIVVSTAYGRTPRFVEDSLLSAFQESFSFATERSEIGVSGPSTVGWDSEFGNPGVNGTVLAIGVDGSGNVYVGGEFSMAGGIPANRIAKWDGQNWADLGSSLVSRFGGGFKVTAIAIDGEDMYIGGIASGGGFLARWTGSSWSTEEYGSAYDVFGGSGTIQGVAINGSDVYVRGFFTAIGREGLREINMAKWNGTKWEQTGVVNPGRLPIVAHGGQIYASAVSTYTPQGTFIASYNIGRLVANNWDPVGGDVNGTVSGIAFKGNDMYLAGSFTSAGGLPVNRIAKWDGSQWSALGTGLNNSATAIAVHNNDVYVAGNFTQAGGQQVSHIARWDGTNWYPLGTGVNSTIYSIVPSNGKIYVGGDFLATGGQFASRIGRWTPTPCIGAEAISDLQLNPNGGYLGDAADGFSASLGFLTSTDTIPTPCTPTPMPALQTIVGVDFFFPTIASPAPTASQPNRWLYDGSYKPNFEGESRTVTMSYSDGVNAPKLIDMTQASRCIYDDHLPEVITGEAGTWTWNIDVSPSCIDMQFSTDSNWITITQFQVVSRSKKIMKMTLDPLPPGVEWRKGVISFGTARHVFVQVRDEEDFNLIKFAKQKVFDYFIRSKKCTQGPFNRPCTYTTMGVRG